jgi:two-component system, NarL family, sensor histidine kinase UhpB
VILLSKFTARSRGRFSLRTQLNVFAAIILVPALIFAGVLTLWSARVERLHLEDNANSEARAVTAVIERNIAFLQITLEALASSPSLESENFNAFFSQAAEVSRKINLQIALRDVHLDQQVLDTAFPFGFPLSGGMQYPRADGEQELLRSGKPIVTNVFSGGAIDQYLVEIAVPVFHGNDLRFVLSADVPLQSFAGLLSSSDTDSEQVVGVIDRNGIYVTRSDQHSKFAGTRAGGPDTFHWFNRRSDVLGWTIAIGIPDRALLVPITRALACFAAVAFALVIVSIGVSQAWTDRMSPSFGALGIDRKPTREEFEALFESSPNGVMVVDDKGRIVLVNAQIEKKFAYSREELIGKPVQTLIAEQHRGIHLELRQRHASELMAQSMEGGRELYGQRKDGTKFPIEIDANPLTCGIDKFTMIAIVDISARRLAAERLTTTMVERDELRRRFIHAQEQERLRLAHELHDQTGQSLTAIMLEIKNMEKTLNENDRNRFRMLRLRLEEIGHALHQVAWELRPASIDELGLASALANYVAEWSKQYCIEADFYCADPHIAELSQEVSTVIYRVVQEGLTNVAKHAKATTVSVIIERCGERLGLTIEDDGCGFNTDLPLGLGGDKNGGLGLAGIRERLTLVGGEFEIESNEGLGTTIFARIPLEKQRSAA